MGNYTLMVGDCAERLKELPDASIDAVVTDPPYGLSKQPDMAEVMRHWLNGDDYKHTGAGFMGKSWDSFVPGPSVWRECFRVLKPGGHLLAFFGSRTYDIGALAIRLAGFEVRDQIMWVYGSGFPKSLDVSKAIDKAAGAEREVVGYKKQGTRSMFDGGKLRPATLPATLPAQQWQGWGTALKPAHEPIVMARKPISTTVAANVLKHGTGAINVDGCRVSTDHADFEKLSAGVDAIRKRGGTMQNSWANHSDLSGANPANELGRWPANFIHDGSDEVVGLFPVTGASKSNPRNNGEFKSVAKGRDLPHVTLGHDDNGGSAARFFYCAKASKRDRDENNNHPTVKPTNLMRYLVRMVTPPNGTVLDPFTGSGSTGKACMLEGFNFVGCELSDEYAEIAKARIEHANNLEPEPKPQSDLFND